LAAVRRILTGEQHMTVYKPVRTQAKVAAELAVILARDGELPPGVRTSWVHNGFADIPTLVLNPHAVPRESIEATVIADGFWSVDEVCAGLEETCAEVGITAEVPAP
jgi:D-xylose transport system substrate-binding protein